MTERRYDPLTGEWRTFATHRQDRTFLPSEAACPLCPTRDPATPTEVPEPDYQIVVFDNRYPALTADPPPPDVLPTPPFLVGPALGAAELVVYSPSHHLALPDLGVAHVRHLVDVWADRYAELGSRPGIEYVFVFENRGRDVGATLDHPHGQIYAFPDIPPRPQLELTRAEAHRAERGTCVFCDVVAFERADGVRVVAENEHFLAFVPFAARFPYELHVFSHRHATSLLDLTYRERHGLAALLHTVTSAYDALFGFPLPYVMAMHQAPMDERWLSVSHFHLEFTPLHRAPDRLKYLAGVELGAGAFLNDTAPEATAAALREAADRAGR